MGIEQPGLRLRLDREMRRIAEQHERLRTLYRALVEATRPETPNGTAGAAFARYYEAVHAHFSMEERVAFPALHGLHPEFGTELEALVREHADVCDALDALGRSIEAKSHDGAGQLQSLASLLERHEAREEALVAALVSSD